MITRKAGPAPWPPAAPSSSSPPPRPRSAPGPGGTGGAGGHPAGVINIVTSHQASAVGDELCSNKTVRKLSFTGSTRIGKLLMRQCADTMKRLSLELGGNAPLHRV